MFRRGLRLAQRKEGYEVIEMQERGRVEGADRITLLELRTGRPATGTPIASIALGKGTITVVAGIDNYQALYGANTSLLPRDAKETI